MASVQRWKKMERTKFFQWKSRRMRRARFLSISRQRWQRSDVVGENVGMCVCVCIVWFSVNNARCPHQWKLQWIRWLCCNGFNNYHDDDYYYDNVSANADCITWKSQQARPTFQIHEHLLRNFISLSFWLLEIIIIICLMGLSALSWECFIANACGFYDLFIHLFIGIIAGNDYHWFQRCRRVTPRLVACLINPSLPPQLWIASIYAYDHHLNWPQLNGLVKCIAGVALMASMDCIIERQKVIRKMQLELHCH